MARPSGTTNRNGLLGDYAPYARERMDVRDAIKLAMDRRAGRIPEEGRVSTEVWNRDGLSLVRYRLGSDELLRDAKQVGIDGMVWPEVQDCTSLFGVLNAEDNCRALIHVIEDGDEGFRIFNVTGGADVPAADMHAFLSMLDIPATWRSGADHALEEMFGVRWGDAGWQAVEPKSVVAVTFQRTCFMTRPVLNETVDVMVAPDPLHRLDDADEDRAYWAKSHYRDAAWAEFHRLGVPSVRPGFSSWTHEGEPRVVRVLGDRLDAEIARLGTDLPDEEDEEEPAGPRM